MLFIEYHTESEKQVVWIWDVCKYIGCYPPLCMADRSRLTAAA